MISFLKCLESQKDIWYNICLEDTKYFSSKRDFIFLTTSGNYIRMRVTNLTNISQAIFSLSKHFVEPFKNKIKCF